MGRTFRKLWTWLTFIDKDRKKRNTKLGLSINLVLLLLPRVQNLLLVHTSSGKEVKT